MEQLKKLWFKVLEFLGLHTPEKPVRVTPPTPTVVPVVVEQVKATTPRKPRTKKAPKK